MTPTLRLHHIGIVVADVGAASADYSKRLGYGIATDIVHDTVQTAFVQFVRLPGDSVLIEFVAPDGPMSKLSNALSKGGGLNHLCYETGDIEASCTDLRRKGLVLIQPPVPATAFPGRRIAWLMGREHVLTELVERGPDGQEL